MNGKQEHNELYVIVCRALKKGHGPVDISRYARTKTKCKAGHRFHGNGKRIKITKPS